MLRKSLGLLMGKRPPVMQVGALCLDPDTGRVLLITSRGTGRWIIPKGWPMPGLTLQQAAAREAWEEGGVQGIIGQEEFGRYEYPKEQDSGFAVPVEVRVFPLHVARLARHFPEASERERRWFSPQEAAPLVAEPGLQSLLRLISFPGLASEGAGQT